jgi:hypothetical protein
MAQQRETRETAHPALLAVGCDPDVMVWKQPVGLFRALTDPDRKVLVGIKGQADSIGVVKITITPEMVGKQIGVAFAPEFKTLTGPQRERQKDWQASFEARGGLYRLIRSAAEMVAFVDDIKTGRAFR